MIRTIIVEDDPGEAAALQSLLHESSFDVEIQAVCTNVDGAANAINKYKPQLVFLDISLDRGENGFDLLKLFPKPEFSVIFTTQFNNTDNTIRAIRVCALDFLPKPVLREELEGALQRMDNNEGPAQASSLSQNLESGKLKYVWLTEGRAKVMIEVDNIIYCKSKNVYTIFYLATPVDGKLEYVESKNIKTWEQDLAETAIIRTHREYLLNLKYIGKYYGTHFILPGEKEVLVSRSRRDEVEKRIELFRRGL